MTEPDYTLLWYWVAEREKIRIKKESGHPFPWTDDQILKDWRFCNVRREDDLVTRWIDEHIRKPNSKDSLLWLLLCLCRQINYIPTLERIRDHWIDDDGWNENLRHDFPEMLKLILTEWKNDGKKVYTGAYIISAPPGGGSKLDYTCDEVIGGLWRRSDEFVRYWTISPENRSLRKVHELLTRTNGWGDFLAYQAVVDMTFTDLLNRAPDRETWCAAGPGTKRGLNRLYKRKLDFNLSQEQARSEIRKIYKIVNQETGVQMDFSDVPNILCEYDKYVRTKNGEGTPRNKYVPGRGY